MMHGHTDRFRSLSIFLLVAGWCRSVNVGYMVDAVAYDRPPCTACIGGSRPECAAMFEAEAAGRGVETTENRSVQAVQLDGREG